MIEVKDISNNCKNEKRKYRKGRSIISEVFSDYCSSTSIHGIGYLGAEDKTLIEKIWWIIVFVLSLIACSFLINQTWSKWTRNPVVVTFSTEQNPVWEIPFPAVTICPFNKVEQLRYPYSDMYYNRENLTGKEQKKFWDISLICNLQFVDEHNASETTDEDVIKHIKEVAPQLDDILTHVTFNGRYYKKKPFAMQMTSDGLCFTFNSLGRSDMVTDQVKSDVEVIGHDRKSTGWNVVDGYPDVDNISYPERTAEEGVAAGLEIKMFSTRFNRDFVCGEPVSGFKVLIHNPAEAPRVSQQYILAPINKQVTIAVNPKVVTTSKGLLNIPPKSRNCYFPEEKKLRFFKVYTQKNCKMECISNITKSYCGCLPFYSPRDNETRICGYAKADCVFRAKQLILTYENKLKMIKCSCLPCCASLDYDYQTSAADYTIVQWLNKSANHLEIEDLDRLEATNVKIFFQDSQYLALYRSELYGKTEFLADIGGLLGLFMGFSFLSLLEIIYFVTLRMCCKLYYKRKVSDI